MTRFAQSIALNAPGGAFTSFRADGEGGRALERAVGQREFAGVLDLCLSELAAELFGGAFTAGPDRLTAAALAGIPQVVAPGGLESIAFRDPGSIPERYWGRSQYVLKNGVALVRTSPEECDKLGLEVAQKVCAAKGPTLVILSRNGFGPLAAPGGFLADPGADAAFLESFRNWAYGVEVIEVELNAGDLAFTELATRELTRLVG